MSKLEETIAAIRPLDVGAMASARERQNVLTKPTGSLGRLEELAVQVAGITGQAIPQILDKVVVTMAGDHGVTAEGVSAYPQDVTWQMVENFLHGGAAINVLANHVGARVVVVDMGVASDLGQGPGLLDKKVRYGTANFAEEPAMTWAEALRAVEAGIEVVQEEVRGPSIVATGDMGIGNTTPSSAITAAVTGQPVETVTGRGTGVDDEGWRRKVAVVQRALELHQPNPSDPMDILSKVGGLEIGGLAGVMLGAAARRMPVVIDGFISGAAALIAVGLCPQLRDYLIASHCSAEPGHRAILKWLGLSPLLDLNLRLGEGTGAALGISLIEAALKLHRDMATFGQAGVSGPVADENAEGS